MTKNAYFGPYLAVLGPKILILTGGSKSFGTHVTENHLGNLLGQNGPNIGQKSQFWAKFGRLWAKNPNFYGTHIKKEPHSQLV